MMTGIANRGFLFGDGIFETIRFFDKTPLFLKDHYTRFANSLEATCLEVPGIKNAGQFSDYINDAISQSVHRDGRLRLTVYRAGGGFYKPELQEGLMEVSVTPITGDRYESNKELKLCDFSMQAKLPGALSSIKTLSAQLYVQAAICAAHAEAGDAVVYNHRRYPIETSRANLFMLKEGVVFTPPVHAGCLSGVMRTQLIRILGQSDDMKLFEVSFSREELLEADEIWTTNVVQGIHAVTNYNGRHYGNLQAVALTEKLNEFIGR